MSDLSKPYTPRPSMGRKASAIGRIIRRARSLSRVSLGDMSRSTGIDIVRLSDIERGLTAASVEDLESIADAVKPEPMTLGLLARDVERASGILRRTVTKLERQEQRRARADRRQFADEQWPEMVERGEVEPEEGE